MRALSVLFWCGWVVSLLFTALLFVWHLSIYPFQNPGVRMNEAGVVFLFLMFLRWCVVGGLAVVVGLFATIRFGAPTWVRVVVPLALVTAHIVIGFVNLAVWNAWVSAGTDYPVRTAWTLAVAYFAIPLVVLVALGAAKLFVPTPAPTPRPGGFPVGFPS